MIEFQRKLLADAQRNRVFAEALRRVVTPRCVVADVGSGTGYLSFVARGLGAGTCHLYEMDGAAVELCRRLMKANGTRNMQLHHAFSTEVESPPRADVVITETLGNFALEERILETAQDAASRFLKPGGALVPHALTQWVAPVVGGRLHAELDVWNRLEPAPGVSFAPASQAYLHNMFVKTVRPEELWPAAEGAAQQWDALVFGRRNASRRKGGGSWEAARAREVHGFCLWWDCQVWEDLHLDTSPHAAATHWEQVYLPCFAPVSLKRGDALEVRVDSDTRLTADVRVQWTVTHKRAGRVVHEEHHDTWEGLG